MVGVSIGLVVVSVVANAGAIGVLGLLLLYGLTVAGYEIVLIALFGMTVGKWLVGIKVVAQVDGSVPGWSSSVKRWVLPGVSTAIPGVGWLLSLIVYLSLFWGKDQRGWHDQFGGTIVVMK